MKTIEDHNHDRQKVYDELARHARAIWDSYADNGIECEKCGSEMSDVGASREEREGVFWKGIECPACGFQTQCIA